MMTAWNAFPRMERLFDAGTSHVGSASRGTAAFEPAIDVRSNDDAVVFVCDVPGLKREDLEVTIDRGVLTIAGERRYESKPEGKPEGKSNDRVWLGRGYGSFKRSFTLPDIVDAERLTADLAEGVLTITVPKQARAKARRVPIG